MIRSRNSKFIPNHLELREVAALCSASYLEQKANALHQLQNSSNNFSSTAREILSLKYNTWFSWLQEVENLLCKDVINAKEIAMVISDRLERVYVCTMKENPEYFDKKYTTVWLEAHSYMYEYLKAKIAQLPEDNPAQFMVDITKVLVSVMKNTLFELHELEAFSNDEKVFISFDDICYDYHTLGMEEPCLMVTRLNTYAKYFDFDKDNIVIKDYSLTHALIEQLPEFVVEAMTANGYTIKEVI